MTILAVFAAAGLSGSRTPPADLEGRDDGSLALTAALSAAALVAVPSLGIFLLPASRRRVAWMLLSAAALLAGASAGIAAGTVLRACTVAYAGGTIVSGTELTTLARRHLALDPAQSREDLIEDATGKAESVWTRESIDRCRMRLASTYFLPFPLFALCLLAAVQAGAPPGWPALAPTGGRAPGGTPGAPAGTDIVYDVFISYRHEEPDRTVARELLGLLEANGYRGAMDERDFRVNESFLSEMERCIRQSRYTVAIVSSRYLESGNCEEEAIISKILDMNERRRRLVPIYIERVATPVWLHGIVGIDATAHDAMVEPFERLKAVL